MNIIYKEGKSHTNFDGLSRWSLDNFKSNPDYEPELASKIPIHFMDIERKRNFKFSEWDPEFGTSECDKTEPEEKATPILEISSSELNNEFFSSVSKLYAKHKNCSIMLQILKEKYRILELGGLVEGL
ncbi:hypothetical protein O181_129472 [Austropuccinia psidii MF-1]|uniref:Uncharacterized protein n=1 Tax=Austropuccinia psidii MF-1 TaxID=1389203 RepID=A0A9Q3L1W3_9BASI|nr:hypothetical protein [Austropuccinia psidii MF-1]